MSEVVAGSRALRAAGEDLVRQRNGLGPQIEAASGDKPWGDDEYGEAFDRRYRPVERQVLDAWSQLAEYVTKLGEKS
jgi:hypothetical protein